MNLILYTFAPKDRSGKIRWLLEELGLQFQIKTLNAADNEHKNDAFKNISPFSTVPVLKDGDSIIFESGAIAVYLCDKYSASVSLAPPIESTGPVVTARLLAQNLINKPAKAKISS